MLISIANFPLCQLKYNAIHFVNRSPHGYLKKLQERKKKQGMNTSVQKTDLIKKPPCLGLKGLGGEEHRLIKARPIKSLSSRRSVFFLSSERGSKT